MTEAGYCGTTADLNDTEPADLDVLLPRVSGWDRLECLDCGSRVPIEENPMACGCGSKNYDFSIRMLVAAGVIRKRPPGMRPPVPPGEDVPPAAQYKLGPWPEEMWGFVGINRPMEFEGDDLYRRLSRRDELWA